MAEDLTDYENHETTDDYEAGYIFKKYFLCFLSICGPISEILFLLPLIGMKCAANDCLKHSKYHFGTLFMVMFVLNIWDVFKP